MMYRYAVLILSGFICLAGDGLAQVSADKELLAAIKKIKAVDNHSHAMPARRPDPAESKRPDPLGKTAFPYPVRLRVTNTEYLRAWQALYGYRHQDMTDDHAREALAAKLRLMEQKGQDYPSWVLDQAGIELTLVNAPNLGDGQSAPRFLWVPLADGFLFPFVPDQGAEREVIQRTRHESGLGESPPTLDRYLEEVVKGKLQRWKTAGAVAIKFAIAYVRPLDFADVPITEAKSIYERQAHRTATSTAEQRALQDYLFRAAAREAGRLGLVVHIHTGIGADPYFNISGANPMHLESVFNDLSLRSTKFVIIHGGWPFERQAGAMVLKPNVYVDFSAQTFLRSTRAVSEVLREWLEFFPEKILFGTDAYSEDTPLANWEEKAWLTTSATREALAVALTRMMEEGQITRARAEELARLVLRENAIGLYGLARR